MEPIENPYKAPATPAAPQSLPPRAPQRVAKAFRILIAISVLGSIAFIALVLLVPDTDPEIITLRAYHGSLALIPGLSVLTYYPFLALLLLAYAGMFFFQRWALWLFVGLYIAGALQGLLDGLDIYAAWESFLISLFTLCDGAILALAFTDPLRQRFAGGSFDQSA